MNSIYKEGLFSRTTIAKKVSASMIALLFLTVFILGLFTIFEMENLIYEAISRFKLAAA